MAPPASGTGRPTQPGDEAMVPMMGMPEVPDVSIQEQSGQDKTKRKIISPDYQAQVSAAEAAGQDEVAEKQAQVTTAAKMGANTEQQSAEAAQQQQEYLERLQTAQAEQDKIVQDKMDEARRRREQMEKDSHITSYWDDKGAPAALFSIFVTGLSDMSNVSAGGKQGESPMAKEYAALIAKDEQNKLRKFENSKEFARLAKEDVAEARAMKLEKLGEIKNEQIVMTDLLTKRFKSYADKIGTQDAISKAQEAVDTLQKNNAESHAKLEEVKNAEVEHESGRTTTTTNIKAGKGEKTAGRTDVEARQKLLNNENFATEAAEIATKNEAATRMFSKAQEWWAVHGDEGTVDKVPFIGPLARMTETAFFGVPPTKDGLFKDAPPAARRLFELNEQAAQQIAKEQGGPVANHDRAAAAMLLGLTGKTPAEMAKSARDRATRSRAERESLEANIKFKDVPGSGVSDFAAKGAALSSLIKVTSVKGAGQAAVVEMVERARSAGVPEEMVTGLLKKAGIKDPAGPKTFRINEPVTVTAGGAAEGTE